MKLLNRADELVLLSIWKLREESYGVPIRKHLIKSTDTAWSIGAVYDSLERLTLSGYVISFQSDPTPERGGRSKRYFKLTKAGMNALLEIRKVQNEMWENLPDIGLESQ